MSTNRRNFLKGSTSLSLARLTYSGMFFQLAETGLLADSSPTPSPSATIGHPLMVPNLSHSLAVRCLSKPVLDSRVIDDMETDQGWMPSPVVKLSYTPERAKSGTRSMRFSTSMRNQDFIKSSRSKNGFFTGDEAAFLGQPFSAFATLGFHEPQDWSAYNRISLWCYLHPTKTPTTSLSMQFLSAGASAGPWDPVAIHFINDLKPGEWNHLTWEISEYQRNKVVAFFLFKATSGLPIAGEMTFDFDQLRLERVNVEPVGGWSVTPGKVSYSHFGYRPGAKKVAFSSEPAAETFSLLNAKTGAVVIQLPVKKETNPRGSYTILDFTSYTTPGTYLLECGSSKSEEFPISDDAWNLLIDATLNTFNGFRCGCAVSGAHDACHLETFDEYKGERRSMAGGWHDAANNTQFADSTHMSVYTLVRLHERLRGDVSQELRAARALEEAKWGLDWSLRMRFAPGIRLKKNFTSYWTDSKIGTDDDVVQVDAGYDLRETIYALVALSTAARVLKKTEPALAARALKAAQEDYAEIRPHMNAPLTPVTYGDSGRGSWRDLAAYLALSAAELFRFTANPAYRADAILFGKWLTDLQEQRFLDGSPVTGFFYADAERTQIQREVWGGSDDSGWLALQILCEEFPEEPDWINWYAALLIYSEYYCWEGSMASSPFQVIPTTVWRRKDLETDLRPDLIGGAMAVHASPMFPTPPTDEGTQAQRLAMYEAGTALTPEMRLRIFPIWYNHVQHGSTTAHLCRAAGLGGAAQVRGSLELCELAVQQLQWVVGANPFSRSLIFGIGYDYWQNFTVDNVNFVGGLGLGMNSYEADAPAWPNNAVFPYKEQWSYSNSRIAINLAQSAVPARITGRTVAPATLRELRTGKTTRLTAGSFDRTVPPGLYTVSSDGFEWQLELVGGRTYQLSLDPTQAVDLSLKSFADDSSKVSLEATLRGSGPQRIALKLFNLGAPQSDKRVALKHGEEALLRWKLKVLDTTKPWIAVAIPQSAPDLRKEVFGRFGSYAKLS